MNPTLLSQLESAKQASYEISVMTTEKKDELLSKIADALERNVEKIIEANRKDLENFDPQDSMYDRALLDQNRITGIANDTRSVIHLSDPVGEVFEERTLDNGIFLQRVSVPLGVIGIVYEARPNVTVDAAVLCIKSGNAVLLRGSSNCYESNTVLVHIMRSALEEAGVNPNIVQLMETDRELVKEMLCAEGYIDVVIPRGSQSLIDMVRKTASVPVIETGAGVVHIYVDDEADTTKAQEIIYNAKTQRPSVCNALDTALIHTLKLEEVLSGLIDKLLEKNVDIYADKQSFEYLAGKYPENKLFQASEEDFGREFLDYAMSIKVVSSIDEAIAHVRKYSSKHTEAIVTENKEKQELYIRSIDAAAVITNASTRFTDGSQFGLGAEIGISTQKLHARGPMGLREMNIYKWVARGNGQIRK